MICQKCGADNKEDSKFCSECGTRLGGVSAAPATVESENEGILSRRAFGAVLAVIVILAMVILFVLVHPNIGLGAKTNSSTSTTSVASSTTALPRVLNPKSGTTHTEDIEYDSNTVLTGDVATSGQIIIDSGVTLTTKGHSLFAGSTFDNAGAINAGNPGNNAALGATGQSYSSSYGGSGGSGGGGGGYAVGGAEAPAANLTGSQIAAWYTGKMSSHLTGAGGGGGCPASGYAGNGGSTLAPGGAYGGQAGACAFGGGRGGSGSYGIYIQADRIIAGAINASGQQGFAGQKDGGGGGGGGAVVLAYGSGGLVPGRYNVAGGAEQLNGAAGGSGRVLNYSYGTSPPITPT